MKCSETLEQRPGKTVLASFLTVLLMPLLLIVLSITVLGGPLLLLALGVVSLIGKAAFLCWLRAWARDARARMAACAASGVYRRSAVDAGVSGAVPRIRRDEAD
ncbi:MAG: hypothetical protein QM760_03505 [Nibricoccus sp.]